MSRAHDDQLAGHRAPPPRHEPAEGTRGDRIPHTACRLCWHERLVWRDGVWMLEHRGPLSGCTHGCHDDEALLPSVS